MGWRQVNGKKSSRGNKLTLPRFRRRGELADHFSGDWSNKNRRRKRHHPREGPRLKPDAEKTVHESERFETYKPRNNQGHESRKDQSEQVRGEFGGYHSIHFLQKFFSGESVLPNGPALVCIV